MSEITREDVQHLAGLARIALTDDEVTSLTAELSQIVDAIATVREVAGDDIPATSHPVPMANVLREDVVGETLTHEQAFAGAPSHDGERFRVTAILGEEQ
ncbi:Asp-tRNA(Asn)/Glu-tRNA(Gln) amidotransferase subunit GatC [Agrococcus sp. KRD186]|uniref:Asp-tRNA(Asn)/Glu-tRNA(Gln) amidotransferase subunit GatC n=1 Tax=Agrococcus sp. KRD186 TaxID=2729730 RepID=UPI0019D180F1|nr:Asp-tRNA(Asn)/Glu-tRNA(Gln) amidotransferase subunit GatC [Agrococcus sp. KRD186]